MIKHPGLTSKSTYTHSKVWHTDLMIPLSQYLLCIGLQSSATNTAYIQ